MEPGLVKRLVDELVSLGVEYFDLTGGEPLLYAGLDELVAHIKARGGWCSVTTNGLILTEYRARSLAEAGLDALQMSLDGVGQTHDHLRGYEGAFAAVEAALPVLAAFPRMKNLAVAVTSENVDQLADIEAIADAHNLGLWFTPAAAYTDQIASAISLPDPNAIERVSPRMRRPRSREKLEWIISAMQNGRGTRCKVPDVRYTILSDATLSPCAFLDGYGDLERESISAVTESESFDHACRRARDRAESACENCYIWATR